jgi:hypothetical protein
VLRERVCNLEMQDDGDGDDNSNNRSLHLHQSEDADAGYMPPFEGRPPHVCPDGIAAEREWLSRRFGGFTGSRTLDQVGCLIASTNCSFHLLSSGLSFAQTPGHGCKS